MDWLAWKTGVGVVGGYFAQVVAVELFGLWAQLAFDEKINDSRQLLAAASIF